VSAARGSSVRTLSWAGTFLYTRLFPFVWIGGFGFGTLQLLLSPETAYYNGVRGGAPPGFGWLMLAAWIVGSTMALGFGWGLKRVRLIGDTLEVSNYLRRISIPLDDVVEVRQRAFPHFGSITLELRQQTVFGTHITFIPRGKRARWFGEEGPMVTELKELVGGRSRRPATIAP
jgi:hypothetical protein